MQENSFHLLLDEEMNGVPPLPPEVKTRVQGSMTLLQLLGKTLELYVPMALDTLMYSLGSAEADLSPLETPPPTEPNQTPQD